MHECRSVCIGLHREWTWQIRTKRLRSVVKKRCNSSGILPEQWTVLARYQLFMLLLWLLLLLAIGAGLIS